jgi:hypothetical protein
LRQVAEPHRFQVAGKLDIGALDVAPKLGHRPDEKDAGKQPRRAKPGGGHRPDEGEHRRQHRRRP